MRSWMMAAVLAIVMVAGCGGNKSTKPQAISVGIALPYAENFDGDTGTIQKRWHYIWQGVPAVGSDVFQLSTESFASSPRGMYSGASRGQQYSGYNGDFYRGGDLSLVQDIDLSHARSAHLSFQNRRTVTVGYPLPSQHANETNDPSCHVKVSVNSGQTWSDLSVFRYNTSGWALESVPLDAAVGHNGVRIAFVIPQHASYGSSTSWCIDDLVITAE